MKKFGLALLALVLCATPAFAFDSSGGGGSANSVQFSDKSLPVSSASAGSECLQTNSGNTGLVLGSCGGGGSYPAGAPPQIGGFSATNTSEAETVSGDCAFTRAGTNSYTIACTKTSGTAFGTAATKNTGTSGGTVPLLNAANTWSGAQSFTAGDLLVAGAGAGVATLQDANTASNFTLSLPPATTTLAGVGYGQTWTAAQTFSNNDILLLGSSTGATTLTSANSSANNYILTIPAATDTAAELGQTQTFTGTDTFSTAPVMSGASITSNTIADGSLATQGGLTAGSYTNTNLTVNAQGVITAASNGSGGSGSNPIYTHTLTESGGAATMLVNSSSVAAIDTDRVALGANATITTPASSAMTDGEEVYLIGVTSGTTYTVGFTAGAGTSLATIVLADGTPFGTPAACGAVPATGSAWFKWKYTSANTTLTLMACGTSAPPTALATSVGGTGVASPTAHSLVQAEGSSAVNLITAATAGNIPVDQGSGSDWTSKAMSGDCTLAASGAITCTKTNGTALGTLATATTPLSIANGGSAASALSSWPIATTISTTVSSGTTLTPSSSYWHTNQDVTMTAAETLTLAAPSFANQSESFKICQNGTGGFAPTLTAGGGLTITGTLPTCTTTASDCCDFELYFDSSSTAYVTGYNNGPL